MQHLSKTIVEYGGFVLNTETNMYDLLFVTEFSILLAKNRAKEKAEEINKYRKQVYDSNSILVKQRQVRMVIGDWELPDEQK